MWSGLSVSAGPAGSAAGAGSVGAGGMAPGEHAGNEPTNRIPHAADARRRWLRFMVALPCSPYEVRAGSPTLHRAIQQIFGMSRAYGLARRHTLSPSRNWPIPLGRLQRA